MGNYRFRLSDMIPNAWFYKLKDMNRATTTTTTGRRATQRGGGGGGSGKKKTHHPSNAIPRAPPPPCHSQPPLKPGRSSYYIPSLSEDRFPHSPHSPANPKAFDTKYVVDPPRKSKKKHRVGRPIVTSSVFSDCPFRTTINDDSRRRDDKNGDDNTNDHVDGLPCLDKNVIASTNCRVTSSAADIIINMDDVKGRKPEETVTQEFVLPPILTKPTKKEACPVPKLDQKSPRRRSSAGAYGLRMRASSPRVATKMLQAHRSRKSSALAPTPRQRVISGSFTVVKSPSNPQRDFRESMMEMIVENNIRAAADLEELLACYLSLNSVEYHGVIVKVFKQIWFDLSSTTL